MDILLWVLQGLLAFVFLVSGLMKATQPIASLAEKIGDWVEAIPQATRLIGVVEVLGAIGVILPLAINILPILTPIAAIGLVLTMIGAIITHLKRKETPQIIVNIVILAMAAFVAYGRSYLFYI